MASNAPNVEDEEDITMVEGEKDEVSIEDEEEEERDPFNDDDYSFIEDEEVSQDSFSNPNEQSSFLADVVGLPIDVFTRLVIEYFNCLIDMCNSAFYPLTKQIEPEIMTRMHNISKDWGEALSKLFVTGNIKADETNSVTMSAILESHTQIFLSMSASISDSPDTSHHAIEQAKKSLDDLIYGTSPQQLRGMLMVIDSMATPTNPLDAGNLISYDNILSHWKSLLDFLILQLAMDAFDPKHSEKTKEILTVSRLILDLGKTWDAEAVIFNSDSQRRERYRLEETLRDHPEIVKQMLHTFEPSGSFKYSKMFTEKISQELVTDKSEKCAIANQDIEGGKMLGKYCGKVFSTSLERPTDKSEWFDIAQAQDDFGDGKLRTIWVKGNGFWASLANHKWRYPGSYDLMPPGLYPFFSSVEMKSNGDMYSLRVIKKGEEIFNDYEQDYWNSMDISPKWNLKGMDINLIPDVFLSAISDLIEISDISDGRDVADAIINLALDLQNEEGDPNGSLSNTMLRDRPILRIENIRHSKADLDNSKNINADSTLLQQAVRMGHDIRQPESIQEIIKAVSDRNPLDLINKYPTLALSVIIGNDPFDTPDKEMERIQISKQLERDYSEKIKRDMSERRERLETFKSERNIADPTFSFFDMDNILYQEERDQIKREMTEIKESRKMEREKKVLEKQARKEEMEEKKILREMQEKRKKEEKEALRLQKEREKIAREQKKLRDTDYTKVLFKNITILGLTSETAEEYKSQRARLRQYMNRFRVLINLSREAMPEKLYSRFREVMEELRGSDVDISGAVTLFKNEDAYSLINRANPQMITAASWMLLFFWKLLAYDLVFLMSFKDNESFSDFIRSDDTEKKIRQTIFAAREDTQRYTILSKPTLDSMVSLFKSIEDCVAICWNKANPDIGINMYGLMKETVMTEEHEAKLLRTKRLEEQRVAKLSATIASLPSKTEMNTPVQTYSPTSIVGMSAMDTPQEMFLPQIFSSPAPQNSPHLDLSPIRKTPGEPKTVFTISRENSNTLNRYNTENQLEWKILETVGTKKRKIQDIPLIKSHDILPDALSRASNVNAPLSKGSIRDKKLRTLVDELLKMYIQEGKDRGTQRNPLYVVSGSLRVLYHMVELASLNKNSSLLDLGFGYGAISLLAVKEMGLTDVTVWEVSDDSSKAISLIKEYDPQIPILYQTMDESQEIDLEDISHIYLHSKEQDPSVSAIDMKALANNFNQSSKTRYIACFYDQKSMEAFGFRVSRIIIPKNSRLAYYHQGTNSLYTTLYLYQKYEVFDPTPRTKKESPVIRDKKKVKRDSVVLESPYRPPNQNASPYFADISNATIHPSFLEYQSRIQKKPKPTADQEVMQQTEYQEQLPQTNYDVSTDLTTEPEPLFEDAEGKLSNLLGGVKDLFVTDSKKERALKTEERRTRDDISNDNKRLLMISPNSADYTKLIDKKKRDTLKLRHLEYEIFYERYITSKDQKDLSKKKSRLEQLKKDVDKYMRDNGVNSLTDAEENDNFTRLEDLIIQQQKYVQTDLDQKTEDKREAQSQKALDTGKAKEIRKKESPPKDTDRADLEKVLKDIFYRGNFSSEYFSAHALALEQLTTLVKRRKEEMPVSVSLVKKSIRLSVIAERKKMYEEYRGWLLDRKDAGLNRIAIELLSRYILVSSESWLKKAQTVEP